MDKATIAIPHRLAEALGAIRDFFREEIQRAQVKPFDLVISAEWDMGAIWILNDDELDMQQRLLFRTALWDLNDAFNTSGYDAWKSISEVSATRKTEIERIRRRMEKYLLTLADSGSS